MASFGWPLCVICVGHPCRCHCCCCWCSSDTGFCRWRSIGSAAWPKPPGGSRWGSCSSPAVEGDRKCSSNTAKGKEGNRHNTNTKTSTWLFNWGWGFSRSQWERPHGHCDRESKSWSGYCTCGKNEKKVEVVVVVVILVQVAAYFFVASVANQEATEIQATWVVYREKMYMKDSPEID